MLPITYHKAQTSSRKVHILPPYRPENKIKLAAWLNVSLQDVADHVSVKLIKAVIAQRVIKTPLEIAEMEKAVSISVDMQLAVIKMHPPRHQGIRAGGQGQRGSHCRQFAPGLPGHYYANAAKPCIPITTAIPCKTARCCYCDIGAENAMHYGGDLPAPHP
jgi:Xaa-Pro aminopeptidase